jgi:hypothetical protein
MQVIAEVLQEIRQALRLLVKNIEFAMNPVTVRDGKVQKHRSLCCCSWPSNC